MGATDKEHQIGGQHSQQVYDSVKASDVLRGALHADDAQYVFDRKQDRKDPLDSYEAITIDASRLQGLFGEPKLTGKIVVTVLEHEFTGVVEDQFTGRGMVRSRGQFVVLYYSVMNDLNSKMQPASQVNNRLYVMDEKGRRWETADYTGDYGGVSGSAAVAKGYEQPASWIAPGFEQVTAAVFEVPADVHDLILVWEQAGVKVPLN